MKNKNNKAKLNLVKSLVSVIVAAVCVIVAVVARLNYSFGWFASNQSNSITGQVVRVDSDLFELHVSDAILPHQIVPDPDGDGSLKSPFDDVVNHFIDSFTLGTEVEGVYTRVNDTSPRIPAIYCNMVDEMYREERELAPGSYGTCSFYIVPKIEGDLSFTISLKKIALKYEASLEGDDKIIVLDDSSVSNGTTITNKDIDAYNLIQGHILLFQNIDEMGYYSNLITDSFEYNTRDHTPDENGRYRVTLYWIWPRSFGEIILDPTDYRLHDKPLFANTSEGSTERDSIRTLIKDEVKLTNSRCFIWSSHDDFGVLSDSYYDTYYIDLSDGYNNGDQTIGESLKYFAVEMIIDYNLD